MYTMVVIQILFRLLVAFSDMHNCLEAPTRDLNDGLTTFTFSEIQFHSLCSHNQAAVNCILPKEWKGVNYGGLGNLVMFFDLDCRFEILRLSQALKHRIMEANGKLNPSFCKYKTYVAIHSLTFFIS